MPKMNWTTNNKLLIVASLALGAILTATSAVFSSSFLAILGVSIIFWAGILLYITPSRHFPLTLMNTLVDSNVSNIERILNELDMKNKGIYLPPKNLKNIQSSLVFLPETKNTPLPTSQEVTEKLFSACKDGVFVTPIGLSLSQLLEQKAGTSFTQTNLEYVETNLSRLLIEDLELAESVSVQIKNGTVIVVITGNVLNEICQQTRKQPLTHELVGCLFSSAIACVLAKASGKPVVIQKEEQIENQKITRMEFQIL